MKRYLLYLFMATGVFNSCESSSVQEEVVSEEQAVLCGNWISLDGEKWRFTLREVKYQEYTHFYKFGKDSLIISGIAYRIERKGEDEISMVRSSGDTVVLKRVL